MTTIRVTKEWQRAGVHFVRTAAMCLGFNISPEQEFCDDTPDDKYILVSDGVTPVSTCRIHYLGGGKGKIERVATIKEYMGKHFGREAILEAEKWMKENGVKEVFINSREAALGFYEKLGYIPDYTTKSGSGDFVCIMTSKKI